MLRQALPAVGASQQTIIGNVSQQSMGPPVLIQYFRLLHRWKWVIAGIIGASLIAGLVITLLMTPQYTAEARVEISRESKNVTNVEGLESEQTNREMEFYQTQYALLEARSLAERVARVLRLGERDEFFVAHGISPDEDSLFAGKSGPINDAQRSTRERLAVDILLANVTVSPVRGSALVDLKYTSASPEISQQVVNAWAQQFIASSIDRRFASTADARKFLEGRLAELRAKLEQSERDTVNFATANNIVPLGSVQSTDGQTQSRQTLAEANLALLNGELASAISARIAAQSRSRGGAASMESLQNPALNQLRQRRAEAASEYARLLVQFEPGHPSAEASREQISTLDTAIGQEERRVSGSVSSTYADALEREQRVRAQLEAAKTQLTAEQSNSIQYNIYQREADTNRQLYDALLQRYKEIGVAGVDANNISLVDQAKLPTTPSAPNLVLNLLIAMAAGLVLASAATLALDQVDEGISDPNDVSRLLDLPLLGAIPELKNGLEDLQDPKSAASDAHLTVRSNLAFSTDHGVPRSIMVTSTRPAEGKTTTSLAIAIVLGRTGKKVLLIDADMRSPSIAEALRLPNRHGLSNYLAGDDAWQDLTQATNMPGITMLSSGPIPPNAAELLSNERLAKLILTLRDHYDHVIVDAPPILGLADSPLIARVVEGCVFVAESGGVAARAIRTSVARVRDVNATILGVILTKFHEKNAGYGYGYGYGYGHGYGKKTEEQA